MRSSKFFSILLIFILIAFDLICSESIPKEKVSNFGLFSHLNLIDNRASFQSLPGYKSCCPNFGNETSFGENVGLLYNHSLTTGIDLQMRVSYNQFSSNFKFQEYIGNGLDANNNTIKVFSNHEANFNLSGIEIQPEFVKKNIFSNVNLLLGLNIGLLLNGTYAQNENLESTNSSINYLNLLQNKVWTNYSTDKIENLNMQFGLNVGLNYEFIFNKLILAPELKYSYQFTNIIQNMNWSANAINLGLSIRYIEQDEIKPIPQPIPEPILPKPTIAIIKTIPIVNKELKAYSIDKNNQINDTLKVLSQKIISRQIYPLLTYIFFDENSSDLQNKYARMDKEEKGSFTENNRFLNSNAMDCYYNLLNIIGKRLYDRPNSKITLVGCNSNKNIEKGNKSLSMNRAKTIKNFLVNEWGVNPKNINVEGRNLPSNYSRGEKSEHLEENRRVEIYSENFDIIKPILVFDTITNNSITDLNIRFKANTNTGDLKWDLNTSAINDNENLSLYSISGLNNVDTTLKIEMNKYIKLANFNSTLNNNLTLKLKYDNVDSTIMLNKTTPTVIVHSSVVSQREENGKYVEEYRLIMFDHNSSNVSELNSNIMSVICQNVSSNSEITIKGITDYLGNAEDNMILSENRANSIKNSMPCKAKTVVAIGVGHQKLYDEKTPEGRIYCRTIEIKVETPKNN